MDPNKPTRTPIVALIIMVFAGAFLGGVAAPFGVFALEGILSGLHLSEAVVGQVSLFIGIGVALLLGVIGLIRIKTIVGALLAGFALGWLGIFMLCNAIVNAGQH